MAENVTQYAAAIFLMEKIAWAEGKSLDARSGNANAPSREWILRTYAQCIKAITDPSQIEAIVERRIPEK